MRFLRLLVLPLAVGLVAASPSGPPPAPPRLFISPSGEPFHATPAQPDAFEAWFDQADANHDGKIDKAEFRADAARFFKQLDTNGDGVIDGFEINAYETKIVPELVAESEGRPFGGGGGDNDAGGRGEGRRGGHRPGSGGDGDGSGNRQGPPRGAPIAMLLNEAEPVSGADYDLDGKVSLAEWMRAADARFALLDKTQAGALTREGLRALLPNAPKRRGQGR